MLRGHLGNKGSKCYKLLRPNSNRLSIGYNRSYLAIIAYCYNSKSSTTNGNKL